MLQHSLTWTQLPWEMLPSSTKERSLSPEYFLLLSLYSTPLMSLWRFHAQVPVPGRVFTTELKHLSQGCEFRLNEDIQGLFVNCCCIPLSYSGTAEHQAI